MTYFNCYQCGKKDYLFDDSRCGDCTRLTPEEIRGDIIDEDDCDFNPMSDEDLRIIWQPKLCLPD